jgi:hypothetical protein
MPMNNALFKSCPQVSMRVIATRSKRLLILVDWNRKLHADGAANRYIAESERITPKQATSGHDFTLRIVTTDVPAEWICVI